MMSLVLARNRTIVVCRDKIVVPRISHIARPHLITYRLTSSVIHTRILYFAAPTKETRVRTGHVAARMRGKIGRQ
jgi:hypothetical protein